MRAARRLDGVSRGTTGSSRSNTASIGMPSTFSTRAPSRSCVGLTGRRHVHPVRELPETDREPTDGIGVVRRPDAHVAVAAVRADHGDQMHHPDQHLVVVQVRDRVDQLAGSSIERRLGHAVEQIRVDVLHLFHQGMSTSAVHRSTRVSAAGDALTVGELEAATGASADVQAAVAKTSQTTVMTGRYRERRSRDVRIVRNRTRYYGSVVPVIRSR